ncbi:MAG: hypothetical protein LBI87_11715 [Candidatus Accumulibacter sp.]|nr:hypothetical protein [Accumulibacter sp.]
MIDRDRHGGRGEKREAGGRITLIDAGTLVTHSGLNTTANGQGMGEVSHTNFQARRSPSPRA